MFWPFNILQQARNRIALLEQSNATLRANLRASADLRDRHLERLRSMLHGHYPWTRPHLPGGNFAPWRKGEVYGRDAYICEEVYYAVLNGEIEWRNGRMLLGGKFFSRPPKGKGVR